MGSTFVPLGSLVWTEPFCWVPPQSAYAQHMLMNTWSCKKHCTVWQSHPGYHGILVSIISFDDLPKKNGTRWYHLSHYVQVVGSATTTIISWTIQIKLWSSRQKPIAFSKKTSWIHISYFHLGNRTSERGWWLRENSVSGLLKVGVNSVVKFCAIVSWSVGSERSNEVTWKCFIVSSLMLSTIWMMTNY